MGKILEGIANLAGILGVLLCLFAGITRLMGIYHLGGYETLTLFNIGMGGMVFSGLLKLDMLLREIRRSGS